VAIDDDAGSVAEEIPLVNAALIIELTWAKLYTRAMHKDLGAIRTKVGKTEPIPAEPEMKKSAEKLHDQLQSANRIVGELSNHAGIKHRPVRK